jgi:hypothetical protein
MKTEEHAWRDLHDHAAAQLHTGFADRVLRAAHGPQASAWEQLRAEAGAQLRPGFADRVLRAARELKAGVPSLTGQFALGAATVAVCLAAVLYAHARSTRAADERALASWQQLAAETQDLDATL